MIKVLHKGLNILEFLAKKPQGSTLGEIAEAIGEKVTTTSNIVQVLAKRNYVERTGRRWKLGIGVYMLANNTEDYHKVLCELAEPILKKLSVFTGSVTVLTIWNNSERYVLLTVADESKITVNRNYAEKAKVYKTATGRVLIAYQSEEEIDRYMEKNGTVDGKTLTEEQLKEFKAELTEIKKQGYAVRRKDQVFSAGVPVFGLNGQVLFSIGLYMPEFRVTDEGKIIKELQKAADALAYEIKTIHVF